MSRLWCAIIVVAVCAGCRNSPPMTDPFLGRTTVEPPGTASVAPVAPPYYSSPSAPPVSPPIITQPAGAPIPATPPPTTQPPIPYSVPQGFRPVSSVTPNVSSPATSPAVAAAAPSPNRPVYGPPGGGMSHPQVAAVAPAQQPTPAQPAAPGLLRPESTVGAMDIRSAAAASNPVSATPAGWQPADNSRTAGSTTSAVASSPASASQPPGSAIRIVEPTRTATASSPVTPVAATRSAGEFRPAGTSSLTMPANGATTDTLNQSLPRWPAQDLSQLPPVRNASFNGAPVSASAPASPATSSSSNYGYDAQYRWVKGKLEYSQSARNWRLRYIPPDAANDNYGGSVVLTDANKLAGLVPGDFVVAYGTLGPPSADQGSFAALYNVERIQKQ
jgi:hypothetical protein